MANFNTVCAMSLVRMYWNNGHTVAEIAEAAGKSKATIRRWLKVTGVVFKSS